jgi:hypothetical protein
VGQKLRICCEDLKLWKISETEIALSDCVACTVDLCLGALILHLYRTFTS